MKLFKKIIFISFLLLLYSNLAYSGFYKEIIDSYKLIPDETNAQDYMTFADFSGDFIIYREDHIYLEKDEYGYYGLSSRCNYFNFKIFSPMTEELIATIPYEKIIEGTELESLYVKDNCSKDFFLNWWKDNSIKYPIKVVSYGNIMAVLFQLSFEHKQQYLKVFNIETGETLFSYKIYPVSGNNQEISHRDAQDIFIDNEKVILLDTIYIPCKYKTETWWLHEWGPFSISLYYYKTGEFKEDFFKWEKEEVINNRVKNGMECIGDEPDVIIEDGVYYKFPYYIYNASGNFIVIPDFIINLKNKTMKYLVNDNITPNYETYIDEAGNLFYPDYKKCCSENFIDKIIRYSTQTGNKSVVYKNFDNLSYTKDFVFDNGTIYFLSSKIDSGYYPIPYKKVACKDPDKYCYFPDSYIGIIKSKKEKVWIANGIPTYTGWSTKAFGYNLYRMDEKSPTPVQVTGDFPFKSDDLFIKKGNMLSLSYHIYKFINELDYNCLNSDNVTDCPVGAECKCRKLEVKDITNDNKSAIFTGHANKLSNYLSTINIAPVIPSRSDMSSVFYQGSKFYRIYQIKDAVGKPIPNAVITSTSGIQSFSDDNGIFKAENLFELNPGTYSNKTVNDIFVDVNIDGESRMYFYNKKGEDNFTFEVLDNTFSEKKIELNLGVSGSMGIGAFRLGTVRALGIDLTGKATTGVFFNEIKDSDKFYLEMGRNLTSSGGVKAVLAEADIYGIADAKLEDELTASGIGTQIIKVDDPFLSWNIDSQKAVTVFVWDTLVKNGTLFFPGVGKIISWLWEKVDPLSIKNLITESKAGLQVKGSAKAGIELPALKLSGGNVGLKSGNLSNLGINLPSVSGEFFVEGDLNRYYKSEAKDFGVEFTVSAKMDFTKNIFNIPAFSPLPNINIPEHSASEFGMLFTYSDDYSPDKLSLDFSYEYKKNDFFNKKEYVLSFDAENLFNNLQQIPENLKKLTLREELSSLSWDTKNISLLFKKMIKHAADNISAEFKTFSDNISKTSYNFEIGLGAGLEFGVGAHLNYFVHKRKLEKKYLIDSNSHGIALVEDHSSVDMEYPDKNLHDILLITIEYLKNNAKNLFKTVVKTVQDGVDTVVESGSCAVEALKNTLSSGVKVFLTTYTPLSSLKSISTASVPLSTYKMLAFKSSVDNGSATIGDVALINVVAQEGTLIESFSPMKITFTYNGDNLSNANLSEDDEKDFFIWKFRDIDHKYVKLNSIPDYVNNKIYFDNLTMNGIYGIGFDKTPPSVKFLNLGSNGMINENYIYALLTDDFSGIDINSIDIKIDDITVINAENIENYYNLASGRLFISDNFTKGTHSLKIFAKDSAGNILDSQEYKLYFDIYDNMSDYDNDGVPNYKDKYPFDSGKSFDNTTENLPKLYEISGNITINDIDNCMDNASLKLTFADVDSNDKYYAFFDNCSAIKKFQIKKFFHETEILPVKGLPEGVYKVAVSYLNQEEQVINDSFNNNGNEALTGEITIGYYGGSNIKSLSVKKGWNLISIPIDVVFSTNEKFTGVSTIWGWTGSSWKVWSPDENVINLLNQYKIKILYVLSPGEGYWLNSADESVENFEGATYGKEKMIITSGWNLLGTGENINVEAFSDAKTLWKWTGSNWKVWSPQSAIISLLNQYKIEIADEIKAGEGFWVNK